MTTMRARMTPKQCLAAVREAGIRARKIITYRREHALHMYYARVVPAIGNYGWGDTPAEARQKLVDNILAR